MSEEDEVLAQMADEDEANRIRADIRITTETLVGFRELEEGERNRGNSGAALRVRISELEDDIESKKRQLEVIVERIFARVSRFKDCV